MGCEVVPFVPLDERPLAGLVPEGDLLPQHRVLAYCEQERTVFDVAQNGRLEAVEMRWLLGLWGGPAVIGGALELLNAFVLHSHGVSEAAKGLMLTTAFIAFLCLICLPDALGARRTLRERRPLDAPRAARAQAHEYEPCSQHVQWAPRAIERKGKVIVQQCRWMMVNSHEAEMLKDWSLDQDGTHYAIEPVWEQSFDAQGTTDIASLLTDLGAEAQALERASWVAYTERREAVLVQREHERELQQEARSTVLQVMPA
jgi:hypothetical protein